MDIRVGSTVRPESGSRTDGQTAPPVEARILAVRAPRRRRSGPGPNRSERRKDTQERPDPVGGKVLVLLIPDGSRLPAGLEDGEYRVFLRFARR